ncbi:hypothetical protein ACFLZC_02000 [Patescibacteria group bacterium]
MITGVGGLYIAEVIQEEPLRLKVEETGPYASLRWDDFIISDFESEQIQDDEKSTELLRKAQKSGHPFFSGLKSLGVDDGKLHEILPVETEDRGDKCQ